MKNSRLKPVCLIVFFCFLIRKEMKCGKQNPLVNTIVSKVYWIILLFYIYSYERRLNLNYNNQAT
ncbi:MAG: hypothetical protein A2381_02855 [Bdellovibrionales bacterium RIFOXYB1_FULL_37_110]|nr:MAG: hypothetical protein A2181_03235 [Bdellovibrionales bacterium RIFOXYA1_FULL_38_20]OFZ51445.1 MAG: hypothetical protein A2417_09310 [Bdellovibrionales bacterium RIFOXYC1_FULL_37_79]OFZ55452.1 MAG: hypothetical protein A2328_03310 [Bdellovibrionales bacterium RIFOXYB2_FULL_36_6]OFZ57873.1 MAG: hypothetical protein A2381_02855 [Bdellovibrionales bacterium RIFOXYB1_FULL_37_110]OFZ63599.1 MAG: hypothetical protein A2577_05155 [Bdellovibrionales bacterium RIFOXYD1_FULL_36_51]